MERVFNAYPAYAGHGKHGVTNGHSHILTKLNARVGRMNSRPGQFLEIEADAVTDPRDVEISIAGGGEDILGCCVYVAIPRAGLSASIPAACARWYVSNISRCSDVGGPMTNERVMLAQ